MSTRDPRRPGLSRARGALLGLVALTLSLSFLTPAADAATRAPSAPRKAAVVSITTGSFTVSVAATRNATKYRLYASTSKATMSLSRIRHAWKSAATTSRTLRLTGLRYTSAPVYYRIKAINSRGVHYSAVYTIRLAPPAPTGLRVVGSSVTGLALEWSSVSASRYVITQASDPGFSQGVRTYSITSAARQFTPYDLTRGAQYWFRVRAYNGSAGSSPSAAVSFEAPNAGQNVRVMTYNLLRAGMDGHVTSGLRIASWSSRRTVAAALIRKGNPDVIGIQEGSDWAKGVRGPRQVDDLRSALGTDVYALARTEVPPTESYYFRTGRYILYKSAVYRAVGEGGHWALGNATYAAYQVLANRQTGAEFLAVSVHLEAGTNSLTVDRRREAQARVLLAKVAAHLDGHPMPVVYIGDFNSHEKRPNIIDGPGIVLRAARHVDGDEVAQVVVNNRYNSSNKYLRTAPATYSHVDHIYTPPGVGVRRWEMVLNLVHGKFPGVIASDHNPVMADVVIPY